jgi:hypothetical protein
MCSFVCMLDSLEFLETVPCRERGYREVGFGPSPGAGLDVRFMTYRG